MGKLEGKIALVTGGNSGIGLATAKAFVGEGAYVFITGRRDPELAAAVKEIGNNVTAVRGYVSKLGDLDRLFAQVKREKGRLDVVFANAGIAELAPLEKITEEHFDVIFGVNVKGVVFTVQKACGAGRASGPVIRHVDPLSFQTLAHGHPIPRPLEWRSIYMCPHSYQPRRT